jgi:Mrp family chromosome partitioning ATPase
MKMSFRHPDANETLLVSDRAHGSIYDMLLYTVLQKPRDSASGGIVIALSSSNPGEGVTYVARALLQELAKCELTTAAGVNVSFLRRLHEPTLEAIRKSMGDSSAKAEDERVKGRKSRSLALPERRSLWEGSWQYRRDCINLLRAEFDYTIIDCPSLGESGDLISIAPFVDGAMLVVEANRTRRDQPRQAERCISAAGGTLLGYVLNKQTRDVPRWLYPDA